MRVWFVIWPAVNSWSVVYTCIQMDANFRSIVWLHTHVDVFLWILGPPICWSKRCTSSYFLLIDWLFKVNLLRLMAHSSRIVAQGLWLIAKKKRKLARGTLAWGGRANLFFVGHEPWSLSYEPWAISHEPRTVNSRRVLSNRWEFVGISPLS